MAVATLGQFRVGQGRDQEFLKILGETKALNESLGAVVLVRRTIFGGENAGMITLGALYESAESHAAFMEKLRGQESHPLFVMNQSTNPPATLVARSMALEITPKPSGGIPVQKPVSTLALFRRSGNFDEMMAALAQAQELFESLGAVVTMWRPLYAGSNAGTISLLQGHDSFTTRAQFATKLVEANQGQGGPIGQLIRTGAITPVSSSLSVELEV